MPLRVAVEGRERNVLYWPLIITTIQKSDFPGVLSICLWGKSQIWLHSLYRLPRLWDFLEKNGALVKKKDLQNAASTAG